jgi:hypothetical protein
VKQIKKLSNLATAAIAFGLLLSTSLVQAEAKVCTDGDTVTGIKGLDTVTDTYGPKTIDVDFIHATGYEIYGSGLNLPWNELYVETDPLSVLASINNALTAENPVPDFAGQSGKNIYYIGAEEETQGPAGLIAAFGGENITGELWKPCEEESGNECAIGVAILKADQRFVYADLKTAVTGADCAGGGPPDETDPPTGSYNIVPCISGSWFLQARDGEGYVIEILGPSLEPEMLAYFYTYDDAGNQMWMLGQGFADGDTAVLPVQVTSGPVYGDAYDPDDVLREDWGTLTFKFTSKDTGTVVRASTMGFDTTTVDIERLSSLTGLVCP